MIAIDEFTRPTGWELRIHPSTRRVSTIGGFIAGGHAGMGSTTYGILRDRGNIVALELVSVEDNPRVVELRDDDVNLVHHAYGTNGIITEVEMPLAVAWPWMEVVTNFSDFMTAARFAYELASSDGIIKKVITIDEPPNWAYMSAMKPIGREGWSMVRSMVAQQSLEACRELVNVFGGETTVEARESEGPYRAPLSEFAWGHSFLQIIKSVPISSATAVFTSTRTSSSPSSEATIDSRASAPCTSRSSVITDNSHSKDLRSIRSATKRKWPTSFAG